MTDNIEWILAVVMDDVYGRNDVLRQRLDQAGIEYYGDIPANTVVYLDKPQLIYPKTKRGKRSKRLKKDIDCFAIALVTA